MAFRNPEEQGSKIPIDSRVGQDLPKLRGVNKEKDSSAIPGDQHAHLENVELQGGILVSRGGEARAAPDPYGTIEGIFDASDVGAPDSNTAVLPASLPKMLVRLRTGKNRLGTYNPTGVPTVVDTYPYPVLPGGAVEYYQWVYRPAVGISPAGVFFISRRDSDLTWHVHRITGTDGVTPPARLVALPAIYNVTETNLTKSGIDASGNIYFSAQVAGNAIRILRLQEDAPPDTFSIVEDFVVPGLGGAAHGLIATIGTEVFTVQADTGTALCAFYNKLSGAWSSRAHPAGVSNVATTLPRVGALGTKFVALVQYWPGGTGAGAVQWLYAVTKEAGATTLVNAASVDLSTIWPAGSFSQTVSYIDTPPVVVGGALYALAQLSYQTSFLGPWTFRKILVRWDGTTLTPFWYDFHNTSASLSGDPSTMGGFEAGILGVLDGVPWITFRENRGGGTELLTHFYKNPSQDMRTWVFETTIGDQTQLNWRGHRIVSI